MGAAINANSDAFYAFCGPLEKPLALPDDIVKVPDLHDVIQILIQTGMSHAKKKAYSETELG
ncbi:hypothetical protein [Roseovarius litorisediminis]|uniref:hypothetical protein n=1 Tax=Roseovarius litorisediminis TaxID=1312363 RepID=UPI000A26E85B|nr:hypothetical protein [Roseovarius litorisediminis]